MMDHHEIGFAQGKIGGPHPTGIVEPGRIFNGIFADGFGEGLYLFFVGFIGSGIWAGAAAVKHS